jgi:hypothetical protein
MRYIQAYKEKEIIKGKLSYHAASQAWCILRLKKDFISHYQDLKKKRGDFHYEIVPFLYWDVLFDYLKKAREGGQVPPNLLWVKEKQNFIS